MRFDKAILVPTSFFFSPSGDASAQRSVKILEFIELETAVARRTFQARPIKADRELIEGYQSGSGRQSLFSSHFVTSF
jgi:hypothetical protein